MNGIDTLCEHIVGHEDWLMGRLFFYTKRQDYSKYSSTLEEAWRTSVRELSRALTEALLREGGPVELSPDTDFRADPVAAFGILEAQRHRSRGITIALFLGLMKYYRQTYLDLVVESELPGLDKDQCLLSLNRLYDRIELGFCTEWTAQSGTQLHEDLQDANRLLANEKNKYLTLFASGPTPAFLLDSDNRISAINHAAAELLFAEETPGESYYGNLDLSQALPWLPVESAAAVATDPSEKLLDVRLQTAHGDRDFEVRLAPMLDISGKYSGTIVTLTDVTEARRHEAEVARLNRLLATRSDVNQMVVRVTDRQQLLDEVCHICVERGGLRVAAIRLLDPDGQQLRVAAHCGEDGGYLDWATGEMEAAPDGDGPARIAVRTGEHWVTADVAIAPEMGSRREEALIRGFRSLGAFPLRIEGEVVGCLTLYSETVGFTDEDELRLLDEIAGDVSFALKHIEHQHGRRRLEAERELTAGILTILNESEDFQDAMGRVVAYLKTYTGFDAVGLRMWDKGDFPYFAQEGFPQDFLLTENTLTERGPDGGICRDRDGDVSLECTCGLVLSGKIPRSHPLFTPGGSFWVNDALPLLDLPGDEDPRHHPRNECIHQGYASVALIPLRSREQTVGLLQLNDKRPDRLTLELVQFLEGLGDTIGIALARKTAEQEIVRLGRQSDAILASVADGILVLDMQGNHTYANPAAATMLGHTPEQLVGRHGHSTWHHTRWDGSPYPEDECPIDAVHGDGQIRRGSNEPFWRSDGTRFAAEFVSAPLVDGEEIVGAVVAFRDISRRRLAVEDLAELGQLAAQVVHDLGTVLSSIRLSAKLAKKGVDCNQMADAVLQAVAEGTAITRDFMLLSRLHGYPHLAAARIEEMIEPALTVAEPQLKAAGVEVLREYASAGLPVAANQTEMGRVFPILIMNAGQAMPAGGTLTVGTRYIPSASEVGEVVVTVTHTGKGISPELLPRIFEPFLTTQAGSSDGGGSDTGRGLAVVHDIVIAHGGTISVRSEVGAGTTFEVHLPTARETADVPKLAEDAGGCSPDADGVPAWTGRSRTDRGESGNG